MVELQEYERGLRASRQPGAAMAEAYVQNLMARLELEDGAVLVAELDARVVGFAACFVGADRLERTPTEVQIEDLVVTAAVRRRGVARALLQAIDGFARQRQTARLVLTVLDGNLVARAAYASLGFRAAFVSLERPLD